MADDYEELVELGFEGVDRFATHLYDPVVGFVSKHKPFSPQSKEKHDSGQRQRALPPQEKPPKRRDSPQEPDYSQQRDLPPHPQWNIPPPPSGPPPKGLPPPPLGQPPRAQLPRQRSYSESKGGLYNRPNLDGTYEDSDSDDGQKSKSMYSSYAPDRRRDGSWRDDERYERTVEDRDYYGPSGTAQQVLVRTRDINRSQGALMPRAPSPPPDYGYGYRDQWAVRERPMPRRQRSSSWSPPRERERERERRYRSPPRRERSTSPNHHRALAVVVGALVGGVAGSRVKKGEALPNTVATVGGAVIGGIASREIEKMYDRHKDRRAHEAFERGEAREKRRLERNYNWD